jgi:hypothetical protein
LRQTWQLLTVARRRGLLFKCTAQCMVLLCMEEEVVVVGGGGCTGQFTCRVGVLNSLIIATINHATSLKVHVGRQRRHRPRSTRGSGATLAVGIRGHLSQVRCWFSAEFCLLLDVRSYCCHHNLCYITKGTR